MDNTYEIISLAFGTKNAKWVDLRNKLFYVASMIYLLGSAFLIGSNPCLYPRVSSIGTSILLFFRLFQYPSKNWHLYLFDICYFANVLLIIGSLYEADDELMHANFAFSILLLSGVVTYGNSLVPHCLEIFTTCYIHINPAVTMLVIKLGKCYSFQCSATYFITSASKYYFGQVAFYYVVIIIVMRPYWEKNNIQNLFTYWVNDKTFGFVIKSSPKHLQGIIYIVVK